MNCCNGDGYHEAGCSHKYSTVNISDGIIRAQCTAERFPGSDLLDTTVELEIDPFSITWKDREKLLDEISAVIARYRI